LYGATGKVNYNTIDGDWYTPGTTVGTGVLIISSLAPQIKYNTISNTNVGIYLDSINPDDTDNATVSNNTITATHLYDAIVLCANLSTATANKINVADESGINLGSCGDASPTDTVTSNTINGACAGVLVENPPVTPPTITSDIFFNVTNQLVSSSSDACVTPLIKKKGVARSHPLVSPARRSLTQ
jgi:nitrous oxidase accessory protein NosD